MAERDVTGTEPDRKVRPGAFGVNVDDDPLGTQDGSLVTAQNFLRLNDAGGLRKRGGLSLFVDLGANAILSLLNVALANPPMVSPETGLPTEEGDAMYCKVYKSANQSISNNTLTLVTFDTTDFDVGDLHDTVVNNSRITIPAGGDGLWAFIAVGSWQGRNSSGGRTGVYIYKNNSTRLAIAEETPDATAGDANLGTTYQTVLLTTAVEGDYFEVKVQQDSGSALNLLGASVEYASFAAFRLRSVA